MEIDKSLQEFTNNHDFKFTKDYFDKAQVNPRFNNKFIYSFKISKAQCIVISESFDTLTNKEYVSIRLWSDFNIDQVMSFKPQRHGINIPKQAFIDVMFPKLLEYVNSLSNQSDKS